MTLQEMVISLIIIAMIMGMVGGVIVGRHFKYNQFDWQQQLRKQLQSANFIMRLNKKIVNFDQIPSDIKCGDQLCLHVELGDREFRSVYDETRGMWMQEFVYQGQVNTLGLREPFLCVSSGSTGGEPVCYTTRGAYTLTTLEQYTATTATNTITDPIAALSGQAMGIFATIDNIPILCGDAQNKYEQPCDQNILDLAAIPYKMMISYQYYLAAVLSSTKLGGNPVEQLGKILNDIETISEYIEQHPDEEENTEENTPLTKARKRLQAFLQNTFRKINSNTQLLTDIFRGD